MAGRYDFMSGFADAQDPWFRIRNFDVTTTAGVVGVGLISMVLHAVAGQQLTNWLGLVPSLVAQGQIWRLLTWPVMNAPNIFVLLTLAVFFMLGSQLESLMGKRNFAVLVALLTVIPAVVLVLASLVFGTETAVSGLDLVELGVLVAFCAQFHRVRFFNLIPAPAVAAVIIGLRVLGAISDRNLAMLLMIAALCAVALIGLRSFGHASDLEWIPAVGGGSAATAPRRSASVRSGPRDTVKPSRPRRSRSKAKLEVVPPPPNPKASSPENAADIDSLLDKIADLGMDSLSASERSRLQQHSERMRRQRDD